MFNDKRLNVSLFVAPCFAVSTAHNVVHHLRRLMKSHVILQNFKIFLPSRRVASQSLTLSHVIQINPISTNLVVTEPIFNLPNVQAAYDQILFEEYNFNSVLRCPG
jgi:hypothetical protein